jgi:hypothetical protein
MERTKKGGEMKTGLERLIEWMNELALYPKDRELLGKILNKSKSLLEEQKNTPSELEESIDCLINDDKLTPIQKLHILPDVIRPYSNQKPTAPVEILEELHQWSEHTPRFCDLETSIDFQKILSHYKPEELLVELADKKGRFLEISSHYFYGEAPKQWTIAVHMEDNGNRHTKGFLGKTYH